ncbi:UNVERIFIED_CONTAM: hypothetical protein PYX00_007402 [Menopon gallinae]|uniref:Fibronectin type-III domain-containing protein n=1 Tax=Menopon gallinae TaxID=328185 RepID=A0AAW2HJE6_9NEOP
MMTMVKSSEGVSPSPSGKIKKVTLVRRMLKNSVPSDPTVNPDPAENIWLVSRDVYDDTVCDGEWTKLVNSLRLAGDNIQNIRLTNSYVHEKLKECFEEIESIKKMSAVSDAQLGRLSELDVAFSEAVSKKLSDVDLKKYGKIVTFGKLPRRSKSAECSFHRVFATREVRERQDIRRYKINRKQEYGKYCSSCGAVEVSCMQNAMRCWECDGEIVIPGLCSSCDSLKTKPPKGKIQEKRFIDRACSTCNFIRRKRLSLHEKKPCCKCKRMKKLPKDYEKAGRLMKVMPDSSCCSDCDYTSSCDVPHSYPSGESVSTDRDHVMSMHPFSHDYDMSCSVSSSMSEVPKEYGKHTPPATVQSVHELSRVQEEPIEEEFTTPRESMSVEETAAPMTEDGPYLSIPESDTDSQTNWSDEEYQDPVGGITNLPEDKPPPLQLSLLKDLAAKPPVTEVCERMHSAEIALGCLVSGNAKLEEQISTMENISQQNLKLSAILREIMVGMTNHLDVIQQQMEEESEGSDEFEEAVEELHFPETDSIVSEESRVLCAGCLLKKTDDSGVVCQGKIGDALGTVARKECTEKMSGLTVSLPMKLDQKHYPLSTLEWKLKELERETTTLKNNNEFINMFISELQNKLSAELNRMKCLNTREASSGESSSESTIVGFDVSVYQVTTTVTEKSCKEPAIEDTFREETQQKRNFMQMKIEEVFKKEQQRAYEVEVFHQKLEVEGLIIKEREEFYTCSNCSQLTDRIDDFRTIPLALMKGYNPEKLQTLKDVNARGDRENDELLISIEIEVEKEKKSATKKSLRCEYKKSMQREERLPEYDKKLQMLTLYPLWPTKGHQSRNRQLSHPESVPDLKKLINEDASDGVRSIFRMDSDFSTEGMYFIDLERDDFVEIKPPDYSYRSSDEESECCAGDYVQEKKRKKMNAIAAMTMPIPLWTVMEIDVPPTPLAVLNMKDRTCRKREFGRISQIELEEAPVSGVVLVQTQAVASVGLIDSGTGVNVPHRKFPVHHEKQSRFRGGHSSPKRCHASLVYFSPVDEVERAVQEIDPSTEEMSVFVIDATPQEEFSDCLPEPEASLRPELSTAMDLIREIESDVAEVKLDKAIAILPRLESVLREHIQDKMKVLRKRSSTVTNSSLDVFMSTLTFLTDDAEPPSAVDSDDPEDDSVLAENLRSMKTRIYEVVEKETQEREQRMEKNLDRIARLEEENSEVMNFLDTLLDKTLTRVNELDNVRTSAYDLSEIATELICILEKVKREEELERNVERAAAAAAATATASAAEDAKKGGCRKREESPTRTVKIHPDALQGDSRRQANRTREQGVPSTASPGETEGSPPRTPKVVRRPTLPSIAEVSSDKASGESSEDDRFRNPFTNMMATLDKLKSRAKEKKQKCDEIFGKKEIREEPSMIKQVERVGSNSCYVTWKKPSEDTEAIVGYEICVNGKVNQRVRNPERLKAVLCLAGTQPPTEPINIELFALTKDSRKRSIGRAIHSWESTRAPRYTTL